MPRFVPVVVCLLLVFGWVAIGQAHFGLILPAKSMVMQEDQPELEVMLAFCHPFEQKGMVMTKPKVFAVQTRKGKTDLLPTLQETKVLDNLAWKGLYRVTRPGIYAFYFEPQPYWEPAEDKYIIHMTKTYVAALGYEEDWDQEVGLKAEIIPLTRPFGLYVGNVFRGVVKFKGKPLPGADVEVEYWNQDKKIQAPNDYFVTQVVKTDEQGVFCFAPPLPGWWGFAALTEEKEALRGPDNKKKTVEYGAVLWVQYFTPQVK